MEDILPKLLDKLKYCKNLGELTFQSKVTNTSTSSNQTSNQSSSNSSYQRDHGRTRSIYENEVVTIAVVATLTKKRNCTHPIAHIVQTVNAETSVVETTIVLIVTKSNEKKRFGEDTT